LFPNQPAAPRKLGLQKTVSTVASNQTFQKRQKEMARKERQRAKQERKAQRKLEKVPGQPDDSDIAESNDLLVDIESGDHVSSEDPSNNL